MFHAITSAFFSHIQPYSAIFSHDIIWYHLISMFCMIGSIGSIGSGAMIYPLLEKIQPAASGALRRVFEHAELSAGPGDPSTSIHSSHSIDPLAESVEVENARAGRCGKTGPALCLNPQWFNSHETEISSQEIHSSVRPSVFGCVFPGGLYSCSPPALQGNCWSLAAEPATGGCSSGQTTLQTGPNLRATRDVARVRILCDLPGATSELFRYIKLSLCETASIEISTISLCQGMVLNLKATDFVGDVFFWKL